MEPVIANTASYLPEEDYKLIKDYIHKSSSIDFSFQSSKYFEYVIYMLLNTCVNLNLFSNLSEPQDTKNVIIPNGDIFKVLKIRDVIISHKIMLKGAFYIPSFKINL